jgi:hypothetical protein
MGFVGRAIALAGIVTGLLAVGLPYAPGSRYADDGTVFAFLVVLLSFASWFTSDVGRDLLAAAGGAAAFGFFLFLPATAAYDSFGVLDSGSWLGLCAVLIPVGALVARRAGPTPTAPGTRRSAARGLGLPVCTAALVLVVVGIWLDIASDGPSYWNVSASGHAVGILMLVLVALNVVLIGGPAHLTVPDVANLDVIVAAVTFGFVEAGLVSTAFEDFGALGTGAWIEACAGVVLMVGVLQLRSGSNAPVPAAAPAG